MHNYKFAIHIIYTTPSKFISQEEKQFFENMEPIWKFLGYLKKSYYIVTYLKIYSLKEVPLTE